MRTRTAGSRLKFGSYVAPHDARAARGRVSALNKHEGAQAQGGKAPARTLVYISMSKVSYMDVLL